MDIQEATFGHNGGKRAILLLGQCSSMKKYGENIQIGN